MWTVEKQQRLNELQRRALQGSLPPNEQQALDALFHELDQMERKQLRPAFDKMQREHDALRADLAHAQEQNAALAMIADRYADLLARARAQLSSIISERNALRDEYERVLR